MKVSLIDADGDGIDDDGDAETDPNRPAKDNDTLLDSVETSALGYDNHTQDDTHPLANDTDGDGLSDWEELKNATLQTDPTAYDRDNDSVSDGQEVNGYTVNVVWYDANGTQPSQEKLLYGNLKGCHLASDNTTYLDSDGDGLYDFDETDPKNSSRYQWYVSTHDDTNITNQFNPFVRENIPPVISSFHVAVVDQWVCGWGVFSWSPPCAGFPVWVGAYGEVALDVDEVSPFTVSFTPMAAPYSFFGSSGWVALDRLEVTTWTVRTARITPRRAIITITSPPRFSVVPLGPTRSFRRASNG